jgi:uncharacterized protein (TIGR03067 family)
MKRRVLPGLLFALVLTACAHTPPGGARLDGRWAPTRAELGGQDFPIANFGGATLRLAADTYTFGGDSGTYAVVPAASPAQMDIHGAVGPNAGRTIPAIFMLIGDQLTVCYQLGPGERPTELASPKGSQILLVSYRRVP